MVQVYDPYDPEEIRRRQMLSIDNDESSIMGPDEEDLPPSQTEATVPTVGGPVAVSSHRGPAPMTQAQQHYQQTLESMPTLDKYQPTKTRRVMSNIAGVLSGIFQGPDAGQATARHLSQAPYRQAMSNWQQAMEREKEGVKLEGTVQSQDIARQRMEGYGLNAQARMKMATANDKFRQGQLERIPTQEQMMERIHAQHPLTPQKPTPFQEYQSNPLDYREFQEGQHPLRPSTASTPEERMQIHKMEESGRNNRNAANIAARNQPAPATPQQQSQAETLAVQRLIRRDPKFAAFYKGPKSEVIGSRTVNHPGRVITADELPQPGAGSTLGMGGVTQEQASLARDKYRQFLVELEKEKRAILGSKANKSSDWTLEEE